MAHPPGEVGQLTAGATVALVGQPNVGKSALFHRLTGRYVSVSNYPGTTVEITRGLARDLPGVVVLDTPGVVALPSLTEDEALTRGRPLFPDGVVDAIRQSRLDIGEIGVDEAVGIARGRHPSPPPDP